MTISDKFGKFLPYLKNSGLYFFSSLFVAIVGILLNPVFAMNLEHLDYAIIGYFSSFNLLLIPLLHFSLFSFYSRHYYFVDEDKRDVIGNTVLLSSIIIGFFTLILFTVVFYFIFQRENNSFPFYPFAILTFLQLYIGNISSFYLIQLRVKRQAKQYARFSIARCVITSLLTLLLVVYYKYGAEGKLTGALIASILCAVYSFRKSLTEFKIDKGILIEGLKFSAPLTVSALFWYCLTGIDRLFLERIGDNTNLGLYNIGISICSYMGIFYTTVSNTFEPDIYQAIAQKKKKKLIAVMSLIVGTVMFFNILFIVFAPYIIGLLTADRYVEATPFAQILAIHNIMMAIYYMVVKLMIGYGYVKMELFVRITGALVSVYMFYVLIEKWEFYGAAWGQVLSFVLLSVIGLLAFGIKRKYISTKQNI